MQVCWEKFCRYFDVEPRLVPLTPDNFKLDVARAKKMCDENTIGMCGILGSTYTGARRVRGTWEWCANSCSTTPLTPSGCFDDIEAMDKASEELRAEKGWEVPIHVDAASGGFTAPFLEPDLKWDFRLKNVVSINVSGHKYGACWLGPAEHCWCGQTLPRHLS